MINILYLLTYIIIFVGICISVIGLPGVWVVTLGIFFWGIIDGFTRIGFGWIVLFLILSLIATVSDNFVILLGAKKYGASKNGMLGAFIGLIVGFLIGNIIGMLIGMFLGSVIAEMIIMNKDSKDAIKIGFGTIIGYIFSIAVKFIIAIIICLIWFFVIRS